MNRSNTQYNTTNLWALFHKLNSIDEGEQSRILTVVIAMLKIDPTIDFDFEAIKTIMVKSPSVATRTKAFNALSLAGYFEDDSQPNIPFGGEGGER